jgi:hypothetical protein
MKLVGPGLLALSLAALLLEASVVIAEDAPGNMLAAVLP